VEGEIHISLVIVREYYWRIGTRYLVHWEH